MLVKDICRGLEQAKTDISSLQLMSLPLSLYAENLD